MRCLLFVLEFSGMALPHTENFWRLSIESSAPGQPLVDAISACGATPSTGDIAVTCQSTIEVDEHGAFVEQGTILYGKAGSVQYETLRPGVMLPLGDDGSTFGGALLHITSGTGIFKGATGTITTNFRASSTGELRDVQVANIVLSE